MKKLLLLLHIFSLLILCFFSSNAEFLYEPPKKETHICGDYEYAILEDGTAEIYRYTGEDEEVIIPIELDKIPVTSIGFGAFSGSYSMTSVTIPDGVTSIGDWAFNMCPFMKSITIPDSVSTVGGYAFNHCESLPDISIPDSVISIGEHAFDNCLSLTSIKFPSNLTSISDSMFFGCQSMVSVIIPNSVKSIGKQAFDRCTNLTSITFEGTQAEWNAIEKGSGWIAHVNYTIHCTDGDINKGE